VTRGNVQQPLPERPGFGNPRGFLVLVKTYPTPSTKYGETVCCAGLDARTGQWVRIYPVNFRSLVEYKRFAKWQFIEAQWGPPHDDSRPESVRIHQETIAPGPFLPAGPRWSVRRQWLDPIVQPSIEALWDSHRLHKTSLGVIKPAVIEKFIIRSAEGWDAESKQELSQLSLSWMDSAAPRGDLEIIPYDFLYRFRCHGEDCRGHEMEVFDWEIAEAYRSWRSKYGQTGWRPAMEKKFFEELPSRDLHFVLGTHHRWRSWMIVGLLYPPHPKVLEPKKAPRREQLGQREAVTMPLFGLEAQEGDGGSSGEGDDGREALTIHPLAIDVLRGKGVPVGLRQSSINTRNSELRDGHVADPGLRECCLQHTPPVLRSARCRRQPRVDN
jgi:hypothetical protein